jgi:hypothetical protein
MDTIDTSARLRRTVYTLMLVATISATTARVLNVERVYEPSLHRAAGDTSPNAPPRDWPKVRPAPMPTFSSNDRSRWAAIRALVDEGTFVVGRRDYNPDGTYRDSGIVFEDGWQTLDKVLDPQTNLYYSSKPPLFTVILAGEYWLIQRLTGWTLKEHPWRIVTIMVLTMNVSPLAAYLLLLSRLLERYGTTDWGRLFTFAAACFGTFLTTFATTLNNHTVAAFTAMRAVYPLLMDDRLSYKSLLISGLFAGLCACFELPATALLAGLAVGLVVQVPRRTLLAFVPAALIPVGAQAGLNYAQLGDWKPAYEKLDSVWYRYEGSHWNKQGADRQGIDFAGDKEPREVYAFNLLLGHHGVFSLTPVWLLSVAGLMRSLIAGRGRGARWWDVALLTLLVSVVVIVFFTAVVSTVNYGGWSSGPRWFFWLTPLWLLALLPAADRLGAAAAGRTLGYVLLAVSVFSAAWPVWNPWRHPWIYQVLENWEVVKY